MKKIAVILSGCGVFDGSEIHESTLLMLAIANNGMSYTLFAPDMKQHHVINHITGEAMSEDRNVLVEAARIARGDIHPLSTYNPKDFDALMLPGGFGAAKNLSNYAFGRDKMEVNKEVAEVITATHKLHKPIGFLCIAPVIAAKLIGNHVNLTVGDDQETGTHINNMGGTYIEMGATEVAVDKDNLIFSTPCYMSAKNISEVYEGCCNIVKTMMKY